MVSQAEKKKDCMGCVIYDYHSHLLPEKITTERERFWDKVLTLACNTCKDYSNWHSRKKYVLNDFFVQKIGLKLGVT